MAGATALNKMNVNLAQNSESLQQQEILDGLPALVFLERAGRIVFANAEARHLLGWTEDKWVSRPVEEVLWGLFPGTAEPQTQLTGGRSSSPFHATVATRGGKLAPVEGTYCTVNTERREAVIVAQPVGRERTPRPRLMEDVLASLPEAVAIVHDSHVLYTNAAFTQMFGYSADEVSGGDLRDYIVPETRQHESAMLQKTFEEYGRASLETVRMTKDGQLVDVALHVGPLLVGGEKVGHVLTYRDIGERKQVEAKLQHDAMHDVLTGLPNRALFQDRVGRALTRRARRRDQGCGVLYLDVDNFEKINDTLGHASGDMLLIRLADRLCTVVRPQDTAARLGSNEFAILVEGVLNSSDIEAVAKRVLEELERPFDILGYSFRAELSLGAAMAVRDDATVESMLREADLAMYHAKQAGHRYEVFDRSMGAMTDGLQDRERDLRDALSRRQFELWYEPVYRVATGELEGFASVIRFRRGDGSIDGFGDMLPAAEETGLSISIGREALEGVCRQLRDWSKAMPGNTLTLTVKLTHRQFYHEDMVAHLKRTLAVTQADSSQLLLEISEAAVNERPDAAVAILQRIADCGVRVALDEFGSGLAAFNHLVRLPIDAVKVAQMLSVAVVNGGHVLALVESLIHLGKSAGVQVLAQAIDSQEQLSVLRRVGCELGQGPLFGSAMESARALELALEQHRTLPPIMNGTGGSV